MSSETMRFELQFVDTSPRPMDEKRLPASVRDLLLLQSALRYTIVAITAAAFDRYRASLET